MKSIGTKFALQVAIVLVVVMAAFGVSEFYHQKNQFTDFLDEKEEASLQYLSIILGEFLFSMNLESMEQIVNSYLTNAEILSIKILKGDEIRAYSGKDPNTKKIIDFMQEKFQPSQYANAVMRSIPIVYDKKEIGTLEVTFSRQFMSAQVWKIIMKLGISLFLVIAIECFVVLLLARRSITIPLNHLVQAAQQIADGNINICLAKVSSHDEIGSLIAAAKKMITYIHHMADITTKILTGDLCHDFSPRSENDVLGQAFLSMLTYLKEIAATITAIIGKDLFQDIQPKTEQDALRNVLQKMKDLWQSIGEIMSRLPQLKSFSEENTRISLQMASATEHTSHQVNIISTVSRQLSENVDAIAIASREIASNTQEMSTNTLELEQVAGNAVEKVTSANEVIDDLKAHSQEIGEIIKIITDISQQTNLLALNATIEAARAGKAGKGFAVVANEIKNLSRETATSTENIIHKLGAIYSSSEKAKNVIDEVSVAVIQIHHASNLIVDGLKEELAKANESAYRIADAAQESKDITQAITNITPVIQNISEGIAGMQDTAKKLASLADQLQHLVERFKI